jgi:hypothetical protein
MAIATAMYHSQRNPLRKVTRDSESVGTVRTGRQRRLHKAFLRYHDPENWPLLRDALKEMGRADLIGNGKRHLVPAWQPDDVGRRRIDALNKRPMMSGQSQQDPNKSKQRRPR